jgi:hypothetical protein
MSCGKGIQWCVFAKQNGVFIKYIPKNGVSLNSQGSLGFGDGSFGRRTASLGQRSLCSRSMKESPVLASYRPCAICPALLYPGAFRSGKHIAS